ncbi:unnamed protein product [Cyprideis torosa]|uniref:Uncharacterized protein n=1 Tax=Cyprideis torosa TaxID=163714 RepID=A0A7R8W7V1_9CRUS|nr:unnamed protein product [Cyprideis torosa]CAG0887961.1 unnamed protein product [Cyprideis torosa]
MTLRRGLFSFLSKSSFDEPDSKYRNAYNTIILPLEETYCFHDFHSSKLDTASFKTKPMVLLVGPECTGKTTMIRYLLESDYPGMRIGPDPSTEYFVMIEHGDKFGEIPGHALVTDPNKPFRALQKFGASFVSRFRAVTVPADILKGITFVDTPGVLSAERSKTDRGYSFPQILSWLAERVDRILLLFDDHKLDIPDELKAVFDILFRYEDKLRIVLNKSDTMDFQELMRVYGAMMYSLSRVFRTPEVPRVYIVSCRDGSCRYRSDPVQRALLEAEETDLFKDLQGLPINGTLRKVNDLIKRARLAKVHAFIMGELHDSYSKVLFGRKRQKNKLIRDLDRKIFPRIAEREQLPIGDFPDPVLMKANLRNFDWNRLAPLKRSLVTAVDRLMTEDIRGLIMTIPTAKQMSSGGMGDLLDSTTRIRHIRALSMASDFENVTTPSPVSEQRHARRLSTDLSRGAIARDAPKTYASTLPKEAPRAYVTPASSATRHSPAPRSILKLNQTPTTASEGRNIRPSTATTSTSHLRQNGQPKVAPLPPPKSLIVYHERKAPPSAAAINAMMEEKERPPWASSKTSLMYPEGSHRVIKFVETPQQTVTSTSTEVNYVATTTTVNGNGAGGRMTRDSTEEEDRSKKGVDGKEEPRTRDSTETTSASTKEEDRSKKGVDGKEDKASDSEVEDGGRSEEVMSTMEHLNKERPTNEAKENGSPDKVGSAEASDPKSKAVSPKDAERAKFFSESSGDKPAVSAQTSDVSTCEIVGCQVAVNAAAKPLEIPDADSSPPRMIDDE